MVGELKHKSVGTELTQGEFEALDGHLLVSQAKGDLIAASSGTQLERRSIGIDGKVLTADAASATGMKWNSALSGAVTFLVAASNASTVSKNGANFLCDGIADDVQIQEAIDALPAVGGTVVLSEGTFIIAADLILSSSATKINGSGIAATIVKFAASRANGSRAFLTSGAITDIYIGNLTIDGNKANQGAATGQRGIHFATGANRLTVENVRIINGQTNGFYNFAVKQVTYINCEANACGNNGWTIESSATVPSTDVELFGCRSISNGSFGVSYIGHASQNIVDCRIIGGRFASNTKEGIGADTNCKRIKAMGVLSELNGDNGITFTADEFKESA